MSRSKPIAPSCSIDGGTFGFGPPDSRYRLRMPSQPKEETGAEPPAARTWLRAIAVAGVVLAVIVVVGALWLDWGTP